MAAKKAPVKKVPVKKTPKGKKPSFLRKDTSRPARDVKPGDLRSQASQGPKKTGVKSPAETRKSISRKQTGTSRPAKDLNKGGLRAQYLKGAGESAASRTLGTVLRTGLRVAGPVGALASMTVPAGEGSTVPGQAQKAVEKKMKREIRQGPKLAVTGVKEGVIGRTRSLRNRTGQNRPEYPTWKNKLKAPKASVSSSTYSGYGDFKAPKAKSTYSGYGDFKTPKVQSSSSSTAATTAAASGSNGGGSQAASVAKAGGKAKAKVGRQTRYQRNETAMEQRKSSSGKPTKSIFSLFRKG